MILLLSDQPKNKEYAWAPVFAVSIGLHLTPSGATRRSNGIEGELLQPLRIV
jgi:hypothetical protein